MEGFRSIRPPGTAAREDSPGAVLRRDRDRLSACIAGPLFSYDTERSAPVGLSAGATLYEASIRSPFSSITK